MKKLNLKQRARLARRAIFSAVATKVAVPLFGAALVSHAYAAPVEWDAGSATDLNWSTLTNWSLDALPVSDSDVTLPSSIPNPGALVNPETITLGGGSLANTLTFSNSYTLTGGDLTLTAGTITVDPSYTGTINSTLLGAGSITKAGTGTLKLGAALNVGGTVTVNGGRLELANINSTRTSATVIGSGATMSSFIKSGASPVNSLGTGGITLDSGTLELTPTANTANAGLSGRTFTTGISSDTARIDFSGTAATTRTDATLNYGNVAPVNVVVGIQWVGKLNIVNAGDYTFQIGSDDGSRLWIDGKLVIQNDGPKGVITANSLPITLSSGLHDIRVDYTNNSGAGGVNLRYAGGTGLDVGTTQTIIPSTALFQAETNTLTGASNALVIGNGIGNDLLVKGTSAIALKGGAFTQVQLGNTIFNDSSTLALTTESGQIGKALRIGGTAQFGHSATSSTITLGLTGDGTANGGANLYFDGVVSEFDASTRTIAKTGSGRLYFTQTAAANNLTSATTLDIQAGSASLVGNSVAGSFSPIGSANIKLSGAGTSLVLDSKVGHLTNATTFSSAIEVASNATIQDISTGGSLMRVTGPVTINGGSTLTIDPIAGGNPSSSAGAVLEFSGNLSGSGDLNLNSTVVGVMPNIPARGTLILSGDNSAYTGNVTVNAGTLVARNPNSLSAVTLSGTGSAGLSYLFDGNGTAATETVAFNDNVTVSANSILTVGRNGTTFAPLFAQATNKTAQINTLSVGANTLQITNNNGYGIDVTGPITLDPNAYIYTLNATIAAKDVVPGATFSGQVSGFTPINKTGNGTLLLTNAANNFTGSVNIYGGVVGATSDAALGDSSNQINLSGMASVTTTTTSGSAAATVSTTTGLYVGQAVSGTGIAANTTIAAINGPTSITLSANATAAGTNVLTYAGNAAFEAYESFATSRNFIFGSTTTGQNQILVAPGKVLTLNTALTGGNGLQKGDQGILVMNGSSSSYFGQINVSGGIMRVANADGLGSYGTGTTVIGNSGTALQFDAAASGPFTLYEPLTLAGTAGVNSGGAIQAYSGTTTLAGLITLTTAGSSIGADAGATFNLTGGITGGQALTFAGAGNINWNTTGVSGTVPTSLTKIGAGKLTIGVDLSSPALTGVVQVLGGEFELNGSGKLGSTGTNIIGQGAAVTLDNTAQNIDNRLNTRPVWLGGSLTIKGNAFSPTTENFGNNLTPSNVGTVITLIPDGGQSLTIGGGWSRHGTTTVLLRGTNLGNAPGAGVATAKFSAGVTTVGAAGASTRGIIPGVVVDTDATKFGQSFGAYDATNGFQPLAPADYASSMAYMANVRTSGVIAGFSGVNLINSLTLDSGGGVTIGASNPVVLDSGGILAFTGNTGIGSLATDLLTTSANRELIVHVIDRDGNPGASLNIGATIAGTTGGLTKGGNGTLILSQKNQYTGTTTVNTGTLRLSGGSSTLMPGQNMVVNYGGTLDLNGNTQLVGDLFTTPTGGNEAIRFGGNVTGTAGSMLVTNQSNNARTLGGSIQGGMTFVRGGQNTLGLISDNTYTGPTYLIGGTTQLLSDGRLSGTSAITIINATLNLENNAGLVNNNDRVNDAAPITLRTGAISFKNRAQTDSVETFGALTLAQGNNQLDAGTVSGTGINSSEIRFASISQSTAPYNGGTGLDATTNFQNGSGQLGNNPRIFFTSAPAVVNNIVPVWIQAGGGNFAYYSPTLGLMALDAAGAPGYTGATLPAVNDLASAAGNYKIGANGVVPAGGLTVNTLAINGAFNVSFTNASDVLNIGAGGLMKSSSTTNSNIGSVVDEGSLTAGGASPTGTVPLHVYNGQNAAPSMTINSRIIDNGASPVRLIIDNFNGGNTALTSGNNSYTGGTVVNGWVNNGSGGLSLRGAAGAVVIPAGGLTINNSTVTMVTNEGQINPNNTVYVNGGATLTLVGANTLKSLSFDNSGGAATPTVTTGGVLTLTDATPIVATSNNPTSVATVNGTLDFGGGAKSLDISAVSLNGSAFAPYNASLNIAAVIQNSGQITKNGDGNLQLSGQSTFAGGVRVATGGLILGASSTPAGNGAVVSGPVGTGTLTLASGTTLLSSTAVNVGNDVTVEGDLVFGGTNNLGLSGAVTFPGATANVNVPNLVTTGGLLGAINVATTINKTGLGTLAVNGAYTGTVNLPDGGSVTLAVDGDGLGTANSVTSNTIINSTGSINLGVARNGTSYFPYKTQAANKTVVVPNLTFNGSLRVTNSNGYGLELPNSYDLNTDQPINVANATGSNVVQGLTLSGQVTGTTGLTKQGAGTLVLSNSTNSFSGAIDIQGGVVSAANDQVLGNAANGINLNAPGTTGVGLRATGTFSTGRTITLSQPTNGIEVTSGNTLTLTSPFGGALAGRQLVKNDAGTLVLAAANPGTWTGSITAAGASAQVLTGGVLVNQGVLRITDPAALGDASNIIAVNTTQGSQVQIAGGITVPNPLVLNTQTGNSYAGGINWSGALRSVGNGLTNTWSGAISENQDAGITADANNTLNLTGGIAFNAHIVVFGGEGTINVTNNAITLVHSLDKIGSGTTNIQVPTAAPTGNGIRVFAGNLTFSGNGAVSGAGTIATFITPGGTLNLDNAGTPTANRLGGRVMTLRGGNLNLTGYAFSPVTETIGAPTFERGQTTITLTDSGGGTDLRFSAASNNVSPAQSTGGTMATALIRGTNLGSTAGPGVASIAWTAGGLITNGQTGATGTTTKSIVPWAVFDNTASGLGFSFVTADNAAGTANTGTNILRALAASEYSNTAALVANTNALIDSSSGSIVNQNTISPNSLTFDNSTSITMNAGQTLNLSSGGILVRNGSASTISGGIASQPAANSAWSIHTIGTGSLTINSLMNGGNAPTAGGLVKAGGGVLTLSTPTLSIPGLTALSANTLNMQTAVNQGTLKLDGGANTLGANNYLEVGAGATVDLNGNSQFVQGLYTDGAFNGIADAVTAGGTITNTAAGQATLVSNSDGRNWAGQITGNVFYARTGTASTTTIYTPQTYTGGTLINGGTVSLRDYGALVNTPTIDLNFASLTLDNTQASNGTDRIADSTAITMRGGTITFSGRAQTDSTETLGTVSLASGLNVINVTTGGTGINSATLTANLTRPVGSSATVILGALAGQVNQNGQLGSNARMFLTTPTLTNDIIGPWAIISREWASYIPGLGVGQLNANGFIGYTSSTLATASATENVRTTTSMSMTADTTVNTFNLTSFGATSPTVDLGAKQLTLAGGGLMVAPNSDNQTATITNGTITSGFANGLGGNDLYVYHLPYAGTNRQTLINAVIADNGATPVRLIVTSSEGVASAQRTTLNAANTYTGGTVVNGGTLVIGANGVIPAGGITLNAGMLDQALTTQASPGVVDPANVITLNGPANASFVNDNTIAGLVFNNLGGTGTPVVNTFKAGHGTAGRGTLTIGASGIVADSSNVQTTSIIQGRIDTGANPTTLTINPITVNGVSVAPLSPTLAIQGWTGSAGTITKAGAGVLQLNAMSTFTGTLNVTEGGVGFGTLGNTGLAAGNAAGSRYARFNLADNTFLNLTNTDATIGSLSGSGTVLNQSPTGAAATGRTFNLGFDNTNSTFSGTFARYTDVLPNSFQVNKIGSGTMTLTGVNTTTSNLQVSQGGVTFAGTGTGVFANYILLPGGLLTLDNSTTNVNHRLTGGAGTGGLLALSGGSLRVVGNASSPTLETINTVTLNNSGNGYGPTVVTLEANAAQPLTFTVGTTWGGTSGGTGLIRGISATAGNGLANFNLGAIALGAPAGAGTGANGTTTMPIRPDWLGDASATGNGTAFITKDSVTGFLRPLTASEMSSTVYAGASNGTINYALTSVVPMGAGGQFGSLNLSGGAGLTNAPGIASTTPDGLPINPQVVSGGILVASGNSTIGTSRLQTANNTPFYFQTVGDLAVNGVLNGTTGGLAKAGAGTLTLGAKAVHTGITHVNGGSIVLAGGDNTLPVIATGGVPGLQALGMHSPSSVVDLKGNNQLVGSLFNNNSLGRYADGAGTVTNTSPTTVTLTANMGGAHNSPVVLAGNLNFTKTGNNPLTLTDVSTYTGVTNVRANTLTLIDAGTLASTSAVNVSYATLALNNSGLNPIGNVNPQRLPAAAPLTLRGATFSFTSGQSEDYTQTINTVNVNEGQNQIDVPQAPVSATGALTIGNLVLNADATLRLTGGNGGYFANAPSLNNSNLYVTQLNGAAIPANITGKVLAGNIITGDGEFTTYIQPGTTGGNGQNWGIVTMNGTAAGAQATYDATAITAAGTATTNVRIAASGTLVSGGTTYNVLAVRSASTPAAITISFTAANDLLNLASGGLSLTNGAAQTVGAAVDSGRITSGGAATSGTSRLYLHANASTINSRIVDSGTGTAKTRLVANLISGTTTLAGANTYTGGTVVNGGGTLNIAATGLIPAGGLTINNSTVTSTAAVDRIATSNVVTINGGGVLTLGNFANSLNRIAFNNTGGVSTPTVNIGNNSLTLSNTNAVSSVNDNLTTVPTVVGTSLAFIDPDAAFTTSTTAGVPVGLSITAPIHNTAGALNKNGTGSLLLAPSAPALTVTNTSGQAVINTTATAGLRVGQLVTGTGVPAGATITLINPGVSFTITAATTQAVTSVTVSGSTFSSGFNLNSGTLILGNSTNVSGATIRSGPIGTGTLTMADGTALISDSAVRTIANPVVLNGNVTFGSTTGIANASTVAANGVTLSGAVDLGGATRTINVNSFLNTSTLSGIVSSGGVTKTGPGTLVLTGANTYTGPVNVNGGTLQSNATGLGSGGAITFGGGILQHAASTTTDFSSRFSTANNQPIYIDTGANNVTYATALTSATGGSLGKFGAGMLTLTATANYDGPTIINAGILRIGDNSASGGIPINSNVIDSGVLAFNRGAGDVITHLGSITGSGGITVDSGTFRPTNPIDLGGNLGFGTSNAVTTTGTLDLTDVDATFGGILTQNNNATGSNVILPAGRTLTINGDVVVGIDSPGAPNANKLAMGSGGALVVNNPAGSFTVGTRTNATNATTTGTLDLTGLASTSINVSNLFLGRVTNGTVSSAPTNGNLLLAPNNTITASTQVVLGDSGSTGNTGVVSTLTVGTGNTTMTTPLVVVGWRKSKGKIDFAAGGTLTLNNGAGVTDLYISRNNLNTGTVTDGVFDATGGTFIATLNNLIIGEKTGGGTGGANGSFTLGTSALSNVTVNSIQMTNLNGGGTASATMTLNGGTVTLTPTGTGITDGTGTSTLTLNGGTLDLSGKTIGTAGAPIDTLNFQAGTLKNVASINDTAGLTKTTAGTLTLEGTMGYTGATVVNDGILRSSTSILSSTGVTVNAGTFEAGVNQTIKTLTIAGGTDAWAGKVDVKDNALVIPAGGATLADALNQAKIGRAGGAWNGNGLASSTAAADPLKITGVGVIVNNNGSGVALKADLDGQATVLNDILVKYTYNGDANLTGTVTADDYFLIDAGFIAGIVAPGTKTGWYNGDFNYDGKIDIDDYFLIDTAYARQSGPLSGSDLAPLAPVAPSAPSAAVPEPGTMSLLALGAAALLGRRRRTK